MRTTQPIKTPEPSPCAKCSKPGYPFASFEEQMMWQVHCRECPNTWPFRPAGSRHRAVILWNRRQLEITQSLPQSAPMNETNTPMKRYHPFHAPPMGEMEEHPQGDWVRWAEAERELAAKAEEVDACHRGYEEISRIMDLDAPSEDDMGMVGTIAANVLERRAAKKQSPAPLRTGGGWRPIEEAPRDGTSFVAWVNWHAPLPDSTGHVCLCRWEEEGEFFRNEHGGSWIEPTHWQPLPQPPTQPAGATGEEGRV